MVPLVFGRIYGTTICLQFYLTFSYVWCLGTSIFEYMCIQVCTQFLFNLSQKNIPHKLEIMNKSKSNFLPMNVSWNSDELELYTNQASITSSTILTIISITIFLMSVAVQKAIFKMLKRLPQRAINHIIYPYMVKKNRHYPIS